MAKEKKVSEETKSEEISEKKQRYELSDQVLAQGYKAKIDGRYFHIGFDLDYEGKKKDRYASLMEQSVNTGRQGGVIWKATGITYLEDLTDEQLRQLALARVILLNKEQEKIFRKKFYS